ncbi:MAG: transglutaminase-like domain-containing protein [Archaeoglobales archaeon]|nr:transglutaminase-like domain-containing protein [Archaeoglobales archaeon]
MNLKSFLLLCLVVSVALSLSGCEAVGKIAKAMAKSSEGAKLIKPLVRISESLKEKYKVPTTQNEIENTAKEIAKKMDYTNPIVRNLAVQIASKYPGERNIMQVQAIYEYVNSKWRYISDPNGFEYYAYASETISNKFAGDCDDYAIVMSALLLAVDFYPRIIIGCNSDSCHAYPEVYIGTGTKAKNLLQDLAKRLRTTINYHIDTDDGYWLSLDWTSNQVGGKPLVEPLISIYPDGSYKVYKS